MKVLYLGVYRDGSGWSHAALDYILAMDSVGLDVVPRCIKFNNLAPELPERILELESKSPVGADIFIQHTLPSMYERHGKFKKNIGIFCTETSNFISSGWHRKINLLDEAWVTCQQMADACKVSAVQTPVKILPYASDINKFFKKYKKFPLNNRGHFTFYTLCDVNRRKNLASLLKAFHTEFRPYEPVELVIKASKAGMSSEDCQKELAEYCAGIRIGLKLYDSPAKYKQEILITRSLTENEICSLHTSCDCFVLPSYGEAWGIPAFDAMGFQKTPIVTDFGGFQAFVTNDTGWLVPCHQESVFAMNEALDGLYTGLESWAQIDVRELRKAMRQAYTDQETRKKKGQNGLNKISEFSHESIGYRIKQLLE